MKIVHIEDFFHPEAGYQINILSKYMAKKGHEVYILCSPLNVIPAYLTDFFGTDNIEQKDQEFYLNTGVKVIRIPTYRYISGRSIYSRQIFKTVEALKPDILYIHGNDTLIGIQYIFKSHKLGYPIILDSHMLEMASKNKLNKWFHTFYRLLVTPRIIKENLRIIRTQNSNYVKDVLGIPLEQCPWISVGSDLSLFKENNEVRKIFRKENEIPLDAFVVLYLGKLDENKGGLFLAQSIQKRIRSDIEKKLVFLVVGNSSGEYGDNVESILAVSENRIIRFPTQRYIDLPQFYQASDAVVYPKQCSLSFFDAQACGLPVIFEDNEVNISRAQNNNAILFKENDSKDFVAKLQEVISMDEIEYQEMRINARNYVKKEYNYDTLTDLYLDIMKIQRDNYCKK